MLWTHKGTPYLALTGEKGVFIVSILERKNKPKLQEKHIFILHFDIHVPELVIVIVVAVGLVNYQQICSDIQPGELPSVISLVPFKDHITTKLLTRRSIQRMQNSLAESDHYPPYCPTPKLMFHCPLGNTCTLIKECYNYYGFCYFFTHLLIQELL